MIVARSTGYERSIVPVHDLNVALLVGAVVLLAAILAVRLSYRLGLPSLLAYLGLGVLLGEDVLGIRFEDAQLAQALGFAALVLILAEGGLTTKWADMRPSIPLAVTLATVGVAASVSLLAVAGHLVLDISWRLAFLLGAVLSPTDAAAVFSVLRTLPLPPRLRGALEGESGCNDPPVVLVVTLLATAGGGGAGASFPGMAVALIAYQLAAGGAIGATVGLLGAPLLRRVPLPASGLYPIAVLALAVGGYATAALAQASGFLAAYVAGLVLGNARLPYLAATRGFAEGLAWVAQIGLFIMLGLLVSPAGLPGEVLPALVIGFVLVLLIRPVSVLVSAAPFRLPWRQQAFLSWAGLRGAVPIVLTTVPLASGLPGSQRLFNLVFVLVVAFTLLQGTTLPWVAKLFRVTESPHPRDVDVESAPLEQLGADLLQFTVPADSLLHGVEIFELRLPQGAAVTLLVRGGDRIVPTPETVLRRGDEMLVVATREAAEATERRLRAVSRRGRLARWYGESGT